MLVTCGFSDGSHIEIEYSTLTDLDCKIIEIEKKYNITFTGVF